MSILECGRSLSRKTKRKVRTPLGRIPRESGGAFGKLDVTDSVTENIPPRACSGVRMKWGGKSSPLRRKRRRQEKPNPVQGKIGNRAARPMIPGMSHLTSVGMPLRRHR